jgi:hypothetical protein
MSDKKSDHGILLAIGVTVMMRTWLSGDALSRRSAAEAETRITGDIWQKVLWLVLVLLLCLRTIATRKVMCIVVDKWSEVYPWAHLVLKHLPVQEVGIASATTMKIEVVHDQAAGILIERSRLASLLQLPRNMSQIVEKLTQNWGEVVHELEASLDAGILVTMTSMTRTVVE